MSKKISTYGILVALALILSYIESLVPAFFAVPGIKLGLTNVVVLTAFYTLDIPGALLINLVRILLVGVLFGNGVSIIYSLAGGLLSFLFMLLIYKSRKFSIYAVSIVGAIMHNVGQIIVAAFLLRTGAIIWYLLVLWFTGMITGAVVGLIGAKVVERVKPNEF